jgi:hypothetical protein
MKALRIILPVGLGILAAVLNFVVLKGSTAPLELTAVSNDVKAGTELTEGMLERVAVRGDRAIFKSAVPYSDRGLLLGRRVTRVLTSGEVVMWTDVQNADEENLRIYLNPGESTETFPVKPSRIARGLRRGDPVGILVSAKSWPNDSKSSKGATLPVVSRRMVGPFRLLSLGTPLDPSRSALTESNLVSVAVPRPTSGRLDPNVEALDEAISAMASGSSAEVGVLAVEHYKPAPPR